VKSRSRPGRSRRLLKWLLIFATLLAVAFAALGFYLDLTVREQFEGKRFALPARVYARPLELFEGLHLQPRQLQAELDMLGYARLREASSAGEYWQQDNIFLIHIRPFAFWDGTQAAQTVRVELSGNQVVALSNAATGAPVDLARLDPIPIGGIYPGKNEDRRLIRLEQAPQSLVDALLAIEDKRYYQHHGVDIRGIARALVATLSGNGVQGGSTITQQLVKNFFLTPERTLRRKATEVVMALLLELRYDKNDILETYLNEVYFGQDQARAIHGFGLASQFYFNRSVEQLEPHQSALLVAMLKGPSLYNPRHNPERALERRNLVLAEMLRQSRLSVPEYEAAVSNPLDVSAKPNTGLSRYPAFLDLVLQQLRRDYADKDLRTEGLRIFTTLDPLVQKAAEDSLSYRLQALEAARGLAANTLEGAVVVTDRQTAEVQAVVGSRQARYQGFNRALQAQRQVGSLIKPAIYLTALERPADYTLATLLDDSQLTWQEPGMEPWQPENYDKKFHGHVPLWQAFAHSYNVAAVRLGLALGMPAVIDTVRRLGVERSLPTYASTLLGTVNLTPLEVTQMYQTIASGGFRTPLRAIREVLTVDGEPLKRYGLSVEQVVSPAPAYLLTTGLQHAVQDGTGRTLNRYLSPEIKAAGKTGTTDGLRDSWFAGFTGDRVGVVWVGSDSNRNTGLTGATGAMTVWGSTMEQLNPRSLILPLPEGLETAEIAHWAQDGDGPSCENAVELPFVTGSVPEAATRCDAKPSPAGKIKRWFNRLFN
jgi:penicillin-binding protein 1B